MVASLHLPTAYYSPAAVSNPGNELWPTRLVSRPATETYRFSVIWWWSIDRRHGRNALLICLRRLQPWWRVPPTDPRTPSADEGSRPWRWLGVVRGEKGAAGPPCRNGVAQFVHGVAIPAISPISLSLPLNYPAWWRHRRQRRLRQDGQGLSRDGFLLIPWSPAEMGLSPRQLIDASLIRLLQLPDAISTDGTSNALASGYVSAGQMNKEKGKRICTCGPFG
jgi:hypothetical protein